MKIKPYSKHGTMHITIIAENSAERAILTLLTSSEYKDGKKLMESGSTYDCEYSAVTEITLSLL